MAVTWGDIKTRVSYRAHQSLAQSTRRLGVGSGAVRTISGTMAIHMELERRIARFKGTEACVVFQSGFAANAGTVSAILGPDDHIISDELNHASIIDGIRLCKAQRFRYAHSNMAELETRLQEASGARVRVIATDGVFSMDGTIANLPEICRLAAKHDAIVMVDDSHAVGLLGDSGGGTPQLAGVSHLVDIYTGTFGKALGGASGGFTSGRKEIIEMLRQRSRPYLFSNTLAPSIVGASIAVLDMLSETTALRDKLEWNTQYFRNKMTNAGFDIKPGVHPIVPIMLYEATVAQEMAAALLEEGIYVIGFFYPVVAKGKARIRVQLSAAHDKEHLDKAIAAFVKIGKSMKY